MQKTLDYGINQYKEVHDVHSECIGRVVRNEGYNYQLYTLEEGFIIASLNPNKMDRVYVGDFVDYIKIDENYFITEIYPRKTTISKAVNSTAKNFNYQSDEQILATNIDRAFILMASDQRFSISKLERYLLTFSQNTIEVNIIISKADFTEKTDEIIVEINRYYPDIPVYRLSVYDSLSVECIKSLIGDQSTIVLLGSSGVGKSTLVNALNHGEKEQIGETRRDGKGKHTTTYTSLLPLEGTESYLVDTPGFKGIDTVNDVDASVLFDDIIALAQQCKFSDCQHDTEKGCAVKAAIQSGELSQDKYERFLINN